MRVKILLGLLLTGLLAGGAKAQGQFNGGTGGNGSGGGGISGNTAGCFVLAATATTSTSSGNLCDSGSLLSSTEPLSVGASVATTADGTHPSSMSFVGNTTLPSLTASTVTILGPPSATPTAWSIQLPTAIPTTTYVLTCVITGTNCLITPVAPNFGSAFPVTVSGTVTSGGIPCFNSTTNEETSAALTAKEFVLGGGAGACVSADTAFDDGATTASWLTYTGTGGLALTGVGSQLAIQGAVCTYGTGGTFCGGEGTNATAAAGYDLISANSADHTLLASVNNGSFYGLQINQLTTQTGTYNASVNDSAILCNAPSSPFTITLPITGIATGKVYRVKNINAAACTLAPSGGATDIDAALTYVLTTKYAAVDVIWDGAQYWAF